MTKKCPKCNAPMAPTYIYAKEGKKIVRKLYAHICPKCSHVIYA